VPRSSLPILAALACATLHPLAAQTRGAVQWRTNAFAAYQQALSTGKPLLLYVYWPGSGFCHKLESGPLLSPQFQALADKAVFLRSNFDDKDANVQKLVKSLGVERVPFVALLDVAADRIQERGHVLGYFDAADYYFRLSQIFLLPPSIARGRSLGAPANFAGVTIEAASKSGPGGQSDAPKK
jgi:hypothetical protein